MYKGFKTITFNVSMIVAGLFEISGIKAPPELADLISTALIALIGVPALNGPALIITGVIGMILRSVTTTPMGRQRL